MKTNPVSAPVYPPIIAKQRTIRLFSSHLILILSCYIARNPSYLCFIIPVRPDHSSSSNSCGVKKSACLRIVCACMNRNLQWSGSRSQKLLYVIAILYSQLFLDKLWTGYVIARVNSHTPCNGHHPPFLLPPLSSPPSSPLTGAAQHYV